MAEQLMAATHQTATFVGIVVNRFHFHNSINIGDSRDHLDQHQQNSLNP
jgi:hypothetical protein